MSGALKVVMMKIKRQKRIQCQWKQTAITTTHENGDKTDVKKLGGVSLFTSDETFFETCLCRPFYIHF